MSKRKKIIFAILAVLVLIQLFQPSKNDGTADTPRSISASADVIQVLRTSCYDCHSNHTDYPWYAYVQPVGWWLNHHVNEGKRELNFSEFSTYTLKRKLHKLKELRELVEEDKMPLGSYTLIHKNAILTDEQKALLIRWAGDLSASLADTVPQR